MVKAIIFYSWFGLKEHKKKKPITKRTHQQQIKRKYPVFVKTVSLGWSLKLWFPSFAEMTS